MMVIPDDHIIKAELYPFSATRHVADIRVGILTIREKWALLSQRPGYTGGHAAVSPNVIPTTQNVQLLLDTVSSGIALAETEEIKIIRYPWDIFRVNSWALQKDFELITEGRISAPLSSTNKAIAAENIFLENGAVVEHCIINATAGPVYIGKNAEVMEGCMIRGPFALCEGATLKMGSKMYGATTVGPHCVAAGEIKNSILFANSNKGHDGYLGDSVIGEWCNLGGGTTVSNIKNTASKVQVWNNKIKGYQQVGLKCGLLMGDYSRAAINTSFNTGTVVGVCCNVFGEGFPPKFVADFTWGKQRYFFDKALQDIDNWKKLKGAVISNTEREILKKLYNQ